MNEEDAEQGSGRDVKYTIDSAQGELFCPSLHNELTAVFNKIVITALKFTPVVVAHHIPYRTGPTGKM